MANDYTPIGPVPSGIANGTVDATSRQLARDMRGKAYGKDVRETIARMTEWHSIRSSAAEVLAAQSAASARRSVQEIDKMVIDFTDYDFDSAPEIVAARRGKASLGAKIDEVEERIEKKAEKSDVIVERNRIDAIVKLPEGSTTGDAELIDARIGVGGEKHPNAGSAIRTQLTNIRNEIGEVVETKTSKQLLNYHTMTKGYFFTNPNADYSTSDYIKVGIGDRIYVYSYDTPESNPQDVWGIELCDANKNPLRTVLFSGVKNYHDNTDASYIRVSGRSEPWLRTWRTVVELNGQTINEQTSATSQKYEIKDNVKVPMGHVSEMLSGLFEVEESKQLLNYDTLSHGNYFGLDGSVYESYSLYSTSDFIKVDIGARVYVYDYRDHASVDTIPWGIECFDSDYEKIRRVQLVGIKNHYDNQDSSYIKVSGQSDSMSIIAVEQNEQTITQKTYHEPRYKIKENVVVPGIDNSVTDVSYLHGKSLITLGDSITAGALMDDVSKTWGSLIAQRNNMTYKNAGISGSTMGNTKDGMDKNESYKNGRHLEIEGYDYATIWFGWNDFNFCELGEVSTADVTTTLGAYYKTLQEIVMNFPETKVGVIIPYLWAWNDDPQGYTIMQLLNGIKEVCDICAVPYLDINKYNFLQSWGSDYPNDQYYYQKWDKRQEVFTIDSLHPNEKGHAYLSTIIENFLRTL